MQSRLTQFGWKEGMFRMLADFLMVHCSMITALAVSVVYQTAVGNAGAAREIVDGCFAYYTAFFWVLSPIFPIVFLLNGFYTRSRAYAGRYKTWVTLRGVFIAGMVFFAANFLFSRGERVGRSVALPFLIFAALSAAGIRILKSFLEKRYVAQTKTRRSSDPAKKQILVVGGAGYIGSLLVERLLNEEYRVRVLDSLLYGDAPLRPVKHHRNFELIVGDCRNIQDVVRAVRGVEVIIHLAAIVGDPACEQDHATALETNYAATRMLIEIAKGHGVSRLLFASSCSVYGETNFEMDEKAVVAPISLYGHTKVDSEQALLNAETMDFHPTVLRYATVFGLGYRPRFDLVVNLLTAKAREEGVITIFNGEQWRPFVHVRDLVEATIQLLEAPVGLVSGEVFNVGDVHMNHTLTDVAAVIREVFPRVRLEHVENSDRRNYRVNFDKLHRLTGFRSHYTLRDGVEEIKRAFDQGRIADYTDLRYHNERYLKAVGNPAHKDQVDSLVMAAFSTLPHAHSRVATVD